MHNLQNYANILYRQYANNYSLLRDEQAIAQQLISDILTCFAADILDRAPLAAETPMGAPAAPMGTARGAL